MNTDILILKEFKKNLISFFDELIDQFPSEGDLIVIRIYFNDQVDIKEILELFDEVILPYALAYKSCAS